MHVCNILLRLGMARRFGGLGLGSRMAKIFEDNYLASRRREMVTEGLDH